MFEPLILNCTVTDFLAITYCASFLTVLLWMADLVLSFHEHITVISIKKNCDIKCGQCPWNNISVLHHRSRNDQCHVTYWLFVFYCHTIVFFCQCLLTKPCAWATGFKRRMTCHTTAICFLLSCHSVCHCSFLYFINTLRLGHWPGSIILIAGHWPRNVTIVQGKWNKMTHWCEWCNVCLPEHPWRVCKDR